MLLRHQVAETNEETEAMIELKFYTLGHRVERELAALREDFVALAPSTQGKFMRMTPCQM